MSTDYQYDDQGQFYPFFFVTLSALVVIPTTWSALKPSTELENTAPRIDSAFKPKDAEFVDNQRLRQKKRERRVKRLSLAIIGWLFIAVNIYLMITTQRTAPKIWNPYEILDVSMVRDSIKAYGSIRAKLMVAGFLGETDTVAISSAVLDNASRQSQAGRIEECDSRNDQRKMGGNHKGVQITHR